ncbi:MAG: hypothetical protein EHM70_22745 [Chloroflexota bacterium]|nr:MAG: hypothetical protein EHM70_22745 [Chloroflexota bacterium]
MRKIIAWIVGIFIALSIIALVSVGGSNRRAYRTARGAIEQRVEISQERIDLAVEMATKSVDLALLRVGNLPSQQAQAELIKQDIEEIGRRLNEAAELQGEAAVAKMDESIDQFNQTLDTVEDASRQAEDAEVKSTLDRIYGILESVKEQITQVILNIQQ